MMKILYRVLFIFVLILLLPQKINAQEKNITLHFFRLNGCPHCAKEEIFLKRLEEKYPNLVIKDY